MIKIIPRTSPEFSFWTIIAPDAVDVVRANFDKHMQGFDVEPYEYALVTKKGKRIDVIATTKLIDYQGERSILGTVREVMRYRFLTWKGSSFGRFGKSILLFPCPRSIKKVL